MHKYMSTQYVPMLYAFAWFQAMELAKWLDSQGAPELKLPCAMLGIDSLEKAASARGAELLEWAGADGRDKLFAARDELLRDRRAAPLRRRLDLFRDLEANGAIALMNSNALETGIFSAPTLRCIYFMMLSILLWAAHQARPAAPADSAAHRGAVRRAAV